MGLLFKHRGHTSNDLLGRMDLATLISIDKICHCFDLRVILVPDFARLSEIES